VTNEERHLAFDRAGLVDELRDVSCEVDKTSACALDRQQRRHD
jgi:hypothetical protein